MLTVLPKFPHTSFYIIMSSHEQVLGSALRKQLNEDERSALFDQLMLIKNANLDLVNTVISSIISNDDNIILVLGALARNNSFTIQKLVVDEILARLNVILSASDIEAVTTLIYALGNSGSKLAISPLLSTLQYDDIDIQISVISSLEFHLDQPIVQQAIITLLHSTDEDKILEEILKILIDAFENKILTIPSEEMINAIINSAIQLENPNLYELVAKYLHQSKTEEIDIYLDMLKQQHNYGDLHDHIGDTDNDDSRVKRGSDWDASNSDYNLIGSYFDRRNDVTKYPNHKAYIWAKSIGVSRLHMTVGTGGFCGMAVNSRSASIKLYRKAAATVHVFGQTYNLASLTLSAYTSGTSLYHRFYVKRGNSVYKNSNTKPKQDCKKQTHSYYGSGRIASPTISIYLYVGSVSIGFRVSASTDISDGLCTCLSYPPPTAKASTNSKLSFTLSVSADTFATLLVSMHLYTYA